ncbi:DNA cytosine methyltransferase, partial [Francisella tularensis subsp. holarctica]|nr:DNA cytosine methyltransferase [Francisella tularensis subsp. holarctica]
MLEPRHTEALTNIKQMFEDAGYNLSFKLLHSSDFKVPQDRQRYLLVGIRKDVG